MLPVEEEIYRKSLGKKGSGNIHVNGLKMNEYFKRPVHKSCYKPLQISEVASNYDVKCSVKGGGLSDKQVQ